MRLRQILIYSVATATMAFVSPVITPLVDVPSVAQADTRVSVSFNTFYEDLAPHGSWVNYQDSYVFVPARVSTDWRPYTRGHWASTKRYGWMWVSDEPFGWATYHYGRWGYAEDIGWYWIPGKRWAPAWVAWRRSGDHVVWAPLPPEGDDVTVEVRVGDIPDNYWVAVPSRSFLEADLSAVIIDDDTERVQVVEAAEPVGSVVIENNVVVNTVIDVDYVEKATEKKIETVEVKETDDPKQAGKDSDGQIAAFTGEVEEEKDAKPAEIKDVEEVKKEKAESTGRTQQQPGDQQQGQEQQQGQDQQQGEDQQLGQDQQQGQEQPTQRKKKATGKPAQQDETQPEQQQGQGQPQQGEEQPTQKKKKASGKPAQQDETQPEQQQGQGQPQQGEEQQTQRKKKGSSQPVQEEEIETEQLQGKGQPPEKKQKGSDEPAQQEEQPQQGEQPKGECDPATGQGC